MNKEINLKNSFRVELYQRNNKRKLIQYIEANDTDEAIREAKRTFSGNLFEISSRKGLGSVISQKACKLRILKGELTFGFGHGHLTIDVDNMTIFEALEKIKAKEFVENNPIKEIYCEEIINNDDS